MSNAHTRLFEAHRKLCAEALELMRKKNLDYAAGDDPYLNFRMFGGLGFLVRLSDKLSRLRSYEERGKFAVDDEGLKDTIIDIVNYANLYYQYKQEESCESRPSSGTTEKSGESVGVRFPVTTGTTRESGTVNVSFPNALSSSTR